MVRRHSLSAAASLARRKAPLPGPSRCRPPARPSIATAARSSARWAARTPRSRPLPGAGPRSARHPLPGLPCAAALQQPQRLQRMRASAELRTRACGCMRSYRRGTPPMWSTSRWLRTRRSTRSSRAPSKGTSTRWPASVSSAVQRPGVVHAGCAERCAQHRVALSHVGGDQLELAGRRSGRLHSSTGSSKGAKPSRAGGGNRIASNVPPATPAAPRPGRGRGNRPSGERPVRQQAQHAGQRVPPRTRRPSRQRLDSTPGQSERRRHQRHPRNGQRVGQENPGETCPNSSGDSGVSATA